MWGFQVRGLNRKKTKAGTKPESISTTNMGFQVHGLNLKKTEAGTRPERLSSASIGSQVPGLNLKKTEAGTRPERLSSTNMGVPGAYGRYGIAEYGIPGAWSQSEEDGGGDKAGALILNQYGGPRCVWPERLLRRRWRRGRGRSAYPRPIMGFQVHDLGSSKTEAGTRPERLSSTNMGFWCAWSRVHGLSLEKTEAGTRPKGLSPASMGCQVRGFEAVR